MRRQSYWCNIASGEELFPEELIQIILQQERGAVVLDGYSGCGKTSILKKIKESADKPVYLLSYENVIDEILRTGGAIGSCEWYLRDLDELVSIIAVEDVDFLSGKDATQEFVAEMVRCAASKHLVIITGHNIRKRTSILFDLCNPVTFEAKDIDECSRRREKVFRDKYCFWGSRAEDSAHYYDLVISHGYAGDMDYLAWDAAHKFGMRMTAPSLASFRDGITMGENALTAAEFLDRERSVAFASCEEYGRKKRMQELMALKYDAARENYGVEIKFL